MGEKVLCLQCGKVMVRRERRSDGKPFWGCSGYPTCRKAMDINDAAKNVPVGIKKEFIPSVYQQAIFDYIQDKDGQDAVIEAVAGSGKTTTIVEALKYTSGNVAFVAFNKRIADELKTRAPAHVKCCTLHSLGFAALRNALPHKPEVDDGKKLAIAKELLTSDEDYHIRPILCSLASLCQSTLTDPTDVAVVQLLIDRYDVDMNGSEIKILAALPRMLELCASRTTVIDFDDMCWLPVYLNLPIEKFDWLMCDESQDLNACQMELVLRSINEFGRIIAVGDRNQSIYGFRGADSDAIPNLINRLNGCKILPLSITYRCPIEHVKLARQFVPHLEPSPTAIAGEVLRMSKAQVIARAQDGDMILCRINAPLVSMCYEFIRQGKKAVIVGRDIGKGLIQLIDKQRARDLYDLLAKLRDYKFQETFKLEAAGKAVRAASLGDRIDTILALCEGLSDITTLKAKIDRIFTDDVVGVALSSVHRAKGLESENAVFILEPELMPFPKARQGWEMIQERNIQYVAYTRSKKTLVFIDKDVVGRAPIGPLASIELRGEQAIYIVEDGQRAEVIIEETEEYAIENQLLLDSIGNRYGTMSGSTQV